MSRMDGKKTQNTVELAAAVVVIIMCRLNRVGIILYSILLYTRYLVWDILDVCMHGHRIQQNMDQPGKVANPARGQLNRENRLFPVPVRA